MNRLQFMAPFESLLNNLNVMVNSNAFTKKEKEKLANIFRTCKNSDHITDFYNKVERIYLSRMVRV